MATAESTAAPETVHSIEYDPDENVCHLRLDSLGFLGYRVGDDGSVWTRWTLVRDPRTGRIAYSLGNTWLRLKTQSYNSGYHYVPVRASGRKRLLRVNRLILTAFVGACPDGMECCHNDGDKTNNRIENLRWDTHLANMADAKRHGVVP